MKMQRIAIIGNAGGGKSVLARRLGEKLAIPVLAFDDLQWQPNWTPTPEAEIEAVHAAWLARPAWIIDGWGNWETLQTRFAAADTIILVDFPIGLHDWWAAKRQFKAALGLNRGWPPPGCAALPVTKRLFKLMWAIHRERRPALIDLVYRNAADTCIAHLKSPRAIKTFLKRADDNSLHFQQ